MVGCREWVFDIRRGRPRLHTGSTLDLPDMLNRNCQTRLRAPGSGCREGPRWAVSRHQFRVAEWGRHRYVFPVMRLRTTLAVLTVTALGLLQPTAAIASDAICQRLNDFHSKPFTDEVRPEGRRWLEVHWTGFWMDFDNGFGKQCRSSPVDASRELCQWLIENSSAEFPSALAIRVLECYGYRFPALSRWRGWRSDVPILNRERWLLLEIDFFTLSGQAGAIRLSSFADSEDDATVELPPLSKWESTAISQ